MNTSFLYGSLLVAIVVAFAGVLLSSRVRASRTWRAMATPLASIIGSGFLVVAPLLGSTVGAWAPLAMIGIVVLAWIIGDMMRFQIRHGESLLDSADPPASAVALERASDLALSLSYVISVAFYLRLLSAFALHNMGAGLADAERWLTTAILVLIGGVGAVRGLRALESLEDIAVAVKLSIIAALLVGLAIHDSSMVMTDTLALPPATVADPWEATRVLAGLLLVVQGFETSRYLGFEYDATLRARTMAKAQLLSGGIYIVFVLLVLPMLTGAGGPVDETAVIGISAQVHPVLPILLVVAAIMSQFSAAVADTVGSGGLINESSHKKIPVKTAYVAVTAAAVALTWSADIFQVIALASRGFAVYYALQAASATLIAWRMSRSRRAAGFAVLTLGLAVCAVIARPAG